MSNTVALEIPADGRMIYAVPWDQHVLVGTTDTFYSGDLNSLPVTTEAIDYLLAGINRYFPAARLTNDDVLRTFVGARPLLGDEDEASEDALSRDDRVLNSAPGIWAITGGKLTTYRAMAKRLVDGLVRESFADRPLRPCSTTAPLPSTGKLFRETPRPSFEICGAAMVPRPARSSNAWPTSPNWPSGSTPALRFSGRKSSTSSSTSGSSSLDDLLDRRLGAFLLAPECELRPKIADWLEARGHKLPVGSNAGSDISPNEVVT